MKTVDSDQLGIYEVIHRFANAFDVRDWQALENCFLPEIHTDYADLRGTPPGVISAAQFVLTRQQALKNLKTHHLCGNHHRH